MYISHHDANIKFHVYFTSSEDKGNFNKTSLHYFILSFIPSATLNPLAVIPVITNAIKI